MQLLSLEFKLFSLERRLVQVRHGVPEREHGIPMCSNMLMFIQSLRSIYELVILSVWPLELVFACLLYLPACHLMTVLSP